MLYIMVLAAVAAADGDVSCATACARCDGRSASELATVYCALCRECRDRRREWLVTAAPFRQSKPFGSRNMAVRRMAPVQPNHYREDATWNEPRRHQPDCPPPRYCDDEEEIGYIKVYGLKRSTCPPAPPCVTQTHASRFTRTYSSRPPTRMTYTSPRSRHTQPSTSSIQPTYSNQCCPIFMPMLPYPCVCPLGVFAPGPGIFGAGAHYPRLRAFKPGGPSGPSLAANGHSQATSESVVSTTQSTTQTEPVYLYIGIPKEMKNLVESQR
ncbi:uncharacterized protein LOC121738436 [Aricia agestis]|uniref:uncharacterized protein LOC121738436 n=1 Tax=Aricia agestis TaxID=91739 RepID=UPI001C2039EC|nr:uncharacterized protein LOC121738436 [Aricia agestis]